MSHYCIYSQKNSKILIILISLIAIEGHSFDNSYKNLYCTDPRTMKEHAAFTEWADAYTCSKHRCQPGGRNLAIYTVSCKRVEAPESAIECEEVVEDTNMQFPFCCTRLRCLVVVHGEVWTRVLGQPWETLPAAPWSHMYKMKKPPPRNDEFFLSKGRSEGPVYEMAIDQEDLNQDRILKSTNKSDGPVCKGISGRPIPNPDIVIGASQENIYHQLEYFPIEPDKKENPTNLQDLVDAIGTRMGDNENVVHRMSVKVHKDKPGEVSEKRFSRNRSTTGSSEQPLFVEDVNGNGYFSDASNVLTKADNPPKELIEPYMASVENHRRSHASDTTMNVERKHKHAHKKRRSKIHKKHHKDKRKRLNRLNSVELDRKVVSLEDNTVNYLIPE